MNKLVKKNFGYNCNLQSNVVPPTHTLPYRLIIDMKSFGVGDSEPDVHFCLANLLQAGNRRQKSANANFSKKKMLKNKRCKKITTENKCFIPENMLYRQEVDKKIVTKAIH